MYHDEMESDRLRAFFLARLRRFAAMAYHPDVAASPRMARLSRWATLSAYRDCVALGIGDEARAALSRHHGIEAGAGA